jgi:tRNA(Ile)-lysidine synthase
MPYQRGLLVRPLLDVTRKEILAYLEDRSIPFRTDRSNEDRRYLRGRIRLDLLPGLRRGFNPGMDRALCQTARICAAEDEFLRAHVGALWRDLALADETQARLAISAYREQPRGLRWRLLRTAYGHVRGDARGLSFGHVEAMDRLAFDEGEERWLHLPGGIRFSVSGEAMLFLRGEGAEAGSFFYPVAVPGETWVGEAHMVIRWSVLERIPPEGFPAPGEAALLDLDKLIGDIAVRSPRPGDRLRPMGLGGSRKVQDILVDDKVPRRDRWRVPLLADAKGVVWVVGHRLDERVRLYPSTRWILQAAILRETRDSAGRVCGIPAPDVL